MSTALDWLRLLAGWIVLVAMLALVVNGLDWILRRIVGGGK